jgi:hypothetical protein
MRPRIDGRGCQETRLPLTEEHLNYQDVPSWVRCDSSACFAPKSHEIAINSERRVPRVTITTNYSH